MATLTLFALLAGCAGEVSSVDSAFYDGDGRAVHCVINIDESAGNMPTIDGALDRALDRARDRAEVLELYAHDPGRTVRIEDIEHVLAGARDRGLAFVTYADFVNGTDVRPGLALSFDDASIAEWHALRPMFRQYGARVTFYVTRYLRQDAAKKDMLRELAADGHDIGAHSVDHFRAPMYVEDHGLAAYLKEEALPSIQVLRDDGYDVTSYAYPFGARTSELDDAMLAHVPLLRSVAFSVQGVADPCPL